MRRLILLLGLCAVLRGQAAPLQAVVNRAFDRSLNLHALLVDQHGQRLVERYGRGKDRSVFSLIARTRTFGPEDLHDMRSIGKSVLGLLLGAALQEGKLRDVSTPVLTFYPELAAQVPQERRALTLEHLLTMESGLRWQEGGAGRDDEHRLMWAWSPVRSVLTRPQAAAPGTTFTYNSGGTAVLAGVLSRATRMPWPDYARRALLEPLGIHDARWITDVFGRPMVYTGLRLRPRDLMTLGRLVLNHGQWEGRQLVPAAWIEASFRPRLATGFEDIRYGYLWWTGTVRAGGRSVAWAAAFGNGGQRLYVVPDLDLAVVMTGGAYGDLAAAHRLQALFRDLVAAVGDTGLR